MPRETNCSNSHFAVPGDVVAEILDGEAVLLNLTSGVYFGLNETGTRVWQLLEAYGDIPQVIERMANEFAADQASIEADVRRLVHDLTEMRLLVTDDAQP